MGALMASYIFRIFWLAMIIYYCSKTDREEAISKIRIWSIVGTIVAIIQIIFVSNGIIHVDQ